MPLPLDNPYSEHEPAEYFRWHDPEGKVAWGEALAREAEQLLGGRGRLLEVGCGRGELLRGAANIGWNVHGVEMTEAFAQVARTRFQVTVETAPAETALAFEERWDVVILAAVLEHLYEPLSVLTRIRTCLRPGGIVFIDLPNECSLQSKIANLYFHLTGRDWAVNLSPTFPPYHVVGFCPTSLRFALATTGFSPIRLELYRTESCLASGRGIRARLGAFGLRASLALGHAVGMGAGISCWARGV